MILSQCKKKDHTYKVVAIECAGNILETLKVDRFQNLMEILLPILNSSVRSRHNTLTDWCP